MRFRDDLQSARHRQMSDPTPLVHLPVEDGNKEIRKVKEEPVQIL